MLARMRRRWSALFCSSLAALIGYLWLTLRAISIYEHSRGQEIRLLDMLDVGVLGLTATVALAVAGMITRTRKRWPAALALVGASPIAFAMARSVLLLPLVAYLGVSIVLALAGTLATIASALYLLFASLPPAPDDPIPRARIA